MTMSMIYHRRHHQEVKRGVNKSLFSLQDHFSEAPNKWVLVI